MDSVIISGDGMQKELFYVAASRGRESVQVITSDKATLRETIGCSTERQSASELARKMRPGLQQGMNRGFAAACNLARRAIQSLLELGRSITFQEDLRHEPKTERTYDRGIE